MNVAIQNVDVSQMAGGQSPGATMRKKVVLCTKDLEPGELIYKVSVSSYLPTLGLDIFRLKNKGGSYRYRS